MLQLEREEGRISSYPHYAKILFMKNISNTTGAYGKFLSSRTDVRSSFAV
jgi:hypothetical protein